MILASASPRRSELLEQLGFDLTIIPADVDEERLQDETPLKLVERLASEKALHVCGTHGVGEDGFLLAADTIVWMGSEALGKPLNEEDARRMLCELSGKTHHVSTGVCLIYGEGRRVYETCSFVETTDVTFHELTPAQIASYVASGECADKAGAYAIQGLGRLLVKGINGDYANVVGLPVCRVVREMSRLGGDRTSTLLTDILEGRYERN